LVERIVRDPTLIQGVSQQPQDLRRPGQVTECLNGWPSPVEGQVKRQGTKHVVQAHTTYLTDAKAHGIDREGEVYTVLAGHKNLIVNDPVGKDHLLLSGENLFGDEEKSKDFTDQDVWVLPTTDAANSVAKANDTADPDGGNEADRLGYTITGLGVFNTYLGTLDRLFAPTQTDILYRLRVKQDDSDSNFQFSIYDNTRTTPSVDVEFVWGTSDFTSASYASADTLSVTALPDGWFLLEIGANRGSIFPTIDVSALIVPSKTGTLVGTGSVWVHHFEVISLDTSPSLSYLSLENSQLLTDPKDFTTTWTASNSASLSSTTNANPFGPGYSDLYYRSLQKSTSGTLGTFTQTASTFFAGTQMLSCFFREGDGSLAADDVTLEVKDTDATISYTATASWTSGVLAISSTSGNLLSSGVIDHGQGNYEAWISVDTYAATSVVGAARDVIIGVQDAASGTNMYVYAWGARLVDGATSPKGSPFQDAKESLDLVTVQDSTFVANSRITAALTTSKASGPTPDLKAFVFVQQAAYSTQYRISLGHGGSVDQVFVDIDDGGAGTFADERFDTWEIEITGVGTVGATWSLTVAGFAVTWLAKPRTGHALDTQKTAAAAARSIRQVMTANGKRVTADAVRNKITIRSTARGSNVAVTTLVPPTGATATGPTNVIVGAGSTSEIVVPDTALIAENLAGRLQAISGVDASAKNSVVFIEITDGSPITELEAKDTAGDQYMKTAWRSVQFFDELPATCEDGFKIKVAGDPNAGEDDYYVEFDADTADSFSPGVWRESIMTGTPDEIDGATMPHKLTRMQDNAAGSWTGKAYQIFFTWKPVNWNKRRVGSTDLAPGPSFIGQKISGVYYWKNRLGIVSGTGSVLSETSRFSNFWRTTVRDLLDSDPIDISAGAKEVATFNHVVLTDQKLMLYSDLAIYELVGAPLTPKTAELVLRLKERNSRRVTPVSVGRSSIFLLENSQFTNAKEVFQIADNVFDTADITAVNPKYMLGVAQDLQASTVEDLVAATVSGAPEKLFAYKFFYNGDQKVQSAWGTWTFGAGTRILGVSFIQSRMFIYLQRENGVYLETVALGDGIVDAGASFAARLDQRVFSSNPELTVTFASGSTTYVLPYTMDPAETYDCWTAAEDTSGAGQLVASVPGSANKFVLAGDTTARVLVFGQKYTHSVELSQPLRRDQGPSADTVYLEGRVQALRAKVSLGDATEVEVTTQSGTSAAKTHSYSKGTNTGSGLSAADGQFSIPVRSDARKLTTTLKNTKATPAGFLSVEFKVDHSPRV